MATVNEIEAIRNRMLNRIDDRLKEAAMTPFDIIKSRALDFIKIKLNEAKKMSFEDDALDIVSDLKHFEHNIYDDINEARANCPDEKYKKIHKDVDNEQNIITAKFSKACEKIENIHFENFKKKLFLKSKISVIKGIDNEKAFDEAFNKVLDKTDFSKTEKDFDKLDAFVEKLFSLRK